MAPEHQPGRCFLLCGTISPRSMTRDDFADQQLACSWQETACSSSTKRPNARSWRLRVLHLFRVVSTWRNVNRTDKVNDLASLGNFGILGQASSQSPPTARARLRSPRVTSSFSMVRRAALSESLCSSKSDNGLHPHLTSLTLKPHQPLNGIRCATTASRRHVCSSHVRRRRGGRVRRNLSQGRQA